MLTRMPAAHLHRKQPLVRVQQALLQGSQGAAKRCQQLRQRRCSLCHAHAALIKVCMAYERGTIPGNLHFNEPNPNNTSLTSGVLKVSHHSAQHSKANSASGDVCISDGSMRSSNA